MRVLIYVVKKRSEPIENFSGKQFKSMSFHRSKKYFANFYRILLMLYQERHVLKTVTLNTKS